MARRVADKGLIKFRHSVLLAPPLATDAHFLRDLDLKLCVVALRDAQHFGDFIIRRASTHPHEAKSDFLKVIQVGMSSVLI